jgi:histidinol-phosphate aminotransferase
MPASRITPSSRLADLAAYRVPPPPVPVDLALDGNEGPRPPSAVLEGLADVDPEIVRRYPAASALERELASRWRVDPRRLLVTAGADDAIDRFCRALLGPGREIVAPSPTFEMLPRYARLAGGDVVAPEWTSGPYPLDAVLAAVSARTAAIAIVSPNNPTGAVATSDVLRRVAAARDDVVVLADLAYAEFADEDLTGAALGLPNVVVLRTFSKAWGLAGLRVGYASGPAEILGWMRAAGAPYAVSGVSLALAGRALAGGVDAMRVFVERIREERSRLFDVLARLGAEPLPSQANFVLARFADSEGVRAGLARRGIAVRSFPGRADLVGMLRITCPGDETALARLLRALEEVCP